MSFLASSDSAAFSRRPFAWHGWRAYVSRSLLVYLVFGGIAAAANLLAGWLLYRTGNFLQIPYWLATGSAAAVGLVTNFLLNYSFNFKFSGRSGVQQFATFFIVSAVGVVLTAGLSTVLRAGLTGLVGPELSVGGALVHSDFAAHFAAVGLVVLYSYPAHRAISFNVGLGARLRQLATLTAR